METREEVMKLLSGLSDSVWTLNTLGAAFEAGLLDQLTEPRTEAEIAAGARLPGPAVRPVLDTLVALGLAREEAGRFVATPGLQVFLARPWRGWLEADLRA